MEMNTKVILKAKWWTDNKAKHLFKDKGKLEKAITGFVKISKSYSGLRAGTLLNSLDRILASLDAMDKAAEINAKACKKGMHDETKYVLTGPFKKAVDKERKKFQKMLDGLIKEAGSLTFKKIYGDISWRVLFVQFCMTRQMAENINFLIVVESEKKKNKKTFDMFIKEGSKQEINIKDATRDHFTNAFKNGGKPDKKYWDKAVVTTKQYITSGGYLTYHFPEWFEKRCLKDRIKD